MACEAMGSAAASKSFDVASITINTHCIKSERCAAIVVRDLMVELSIGSVVNEPS